MHVLHLLIVILALFESPSFAYNILIFSFGVSNSHVLLDARFAEIVSANGRNNVTLLVEEYHSDSKEVKLSKYVREIRFQADDKKLYHNSRAHWRHEMYEEKGTNFTRLNQLILTLHYACNKMITDTDLLTRLRNSHFDIAIAHMGSLCPMGMIKLLNIPVYIWKSSGQLIDYLAAEIGGTSPPSFVQRIMTAYTDRMTFWERLRNFIASLMLSYYYYYQMVVPYNGIFREHYGVNFPDLSRLASKSSLVFVNSEEMMDYPRPILHKIVNIGGIGLSKPNALDAKWTKIVEDKAFNGVVVFAFGSIANATAMPHHWKKSFIEAFALFPKYKILWKFEGDLSTFKIPPNVIIAKWLPQIDLFGHPNIKACITHAGLNSILEACTNGVPLVTVPLFADQYGNVKKLERQGVSVTVRKNDISTMAIYEALNKILTNESYAKNVKRMSNLIKNKPGRASELVLELVEYVAKNRRLPNLEPASINLNVIQYYSLDIMAAYLFFGFAISLTVFYFVKFILWFGRHKLDKSKSE